MALALHLTSLKLQLVVLVTILSTLPTLVSSSPSASLDLVNPLLGEDTIGSFMLKNPPQGYAAVFIAQTPNCTGLIDNVDVSSLNSSARSCASSPILLPRRRRLPSRLPIFNTYSYSATYDDGQGNGYNITWPTQLCSDNDIGDIQAPDGRIIHNATLQSVYTSLRRLSGQELFEYTTTMLQNASNKFDTEIEAVICDPPVGGTRGLLTRYRASDVSGRWVYALTGMAGSFGVAFGALFVPIVHPGPTANFTRTEDVVLIAASSAFAFVYAFALDALHRRSATNVIEAFILTVIVSTGEIFLSLFKKAWDNICTTSTFLLAEIREFFLHIKNNFFVVGDANNLPAGVQMVPQNDPPQEPPPPPQVQLSDVCN